MAQTIIDDQMLYALYGVAVFGFFGFFGIILFIKMKIPEVLPFLKAEIFKRPVVDMHSSIGLLTRYCPKPEGDEQDGNMYSLPKAYGVKFIPDNKKVEHSANGRRIIHYYSKAAPGLSAQEVKACEDVLQALRESGHTINDSIIDALFIATDEELREWYGVEDYNTLMELKNKLKNQFIRDGQFVWQTVHDFIFAAQSETARGLDEFKSIAEKRADERRLMGLFNKDNRMMIFYIVFILVALGIVYKIMMG